MTKYIISFIIIFSGYSAGGELNFSKKKYKMLDQFEEHSLRKADTMFATRGGFDPASKLYDAFIIEFPKSEALSYALYRKARCLQQSNKRLKAINEYNEILDYFPNDIAFAAGALFQIGQCSWDNQDYTKAMKAWAEMVQDTDYRKHPFAGQALKRLADNMMKLKKYDKAVQYYSEIIFSKTFRKNTPHGVLNSAIANIIYHNVRRKPKMQKYMEYYKKAKGVGATPWGIPQKNLENDPTYLSNLRAHVWRYGGFQQHEKGNRASYYGYWYKKLKPLRTKDTFYQLDVAKMGFSIKYNKINYFADVNKIFKRNYDKKHHNDYVISFFPALKGNAMLIMEYFKKIQFNNLSLNQNVKLIRILLKVGAKKEVELSVSKLKAEKLSASVLNSLVFSIWNSNATLAKNLMHRGRLKRFTDVEINSFASSLWTRDPRMVEQLYSMMKDQDYANFQRLGYLASQGKIKEAIALGKKLTNLEKYANETWWILAKLHDGARQYPQAIKAYIMADRAPASLYLVAECYFNNGTLSKCIGQLQEIENFFKPQAPNAAYTISRYYRRANDRKREVAALRKVIKAYPKTGQASSAHVRLEELGVKSGGGFVH
ncbi:MAG: tetratricopeptide repeat protein [Lentisphaeria bacterium]|nr:tetratricopeptide repeat protein [Lentisphaeria bacterium]NQZ68453.1 tetratricopeptide repeat protein [Lentisphaeria bacterium]